MLHFEQVKKYYGSFLALDIPLLTLAKGVYWLQGENGSGKTSFLKMIGGLHPFDGDISLPGCSIKKQRIGFLRCVNYAEAEPQYPGFLTAKDLIQLYCYTKNGKLNEALKLLQLLQLSNTYSKPLGTYSSGMLKKLSLVLAFIGKPSWILLDEPLITVDADAVSQICSLINALAAEKGISFIITSHQPFPQDMLKVSQVILAANKTINMEHE